MKTIGLIPAYEAQDTVAAVVRGVHRFLEHVIVIDDGSSDATSAAARETGAELVRFERNRGKGAALRVGFSRALEKGAAAAITIDADGQHDPAEIPRLLAHWKETEAGIVIGSRARAYDGMTRARRFGNRFSNRAVSFFAGALIEDAQSGLRLYDGRLLRQVPLRGTRYELESEILVKAVRAGFAVRCVHVGVHEVDGTATSHFRPVRDTARICAAVVRSRFWRPACS